MGYTEILGQDQAKVMIMNSFNNNKLSHAYLLYGPEGVGKEMFSLRSACQFNCFSLIDGEYCGKCSSCQKILANNHPDVKWIFPIPKSSKPKEIESFYKERIEKPYLDGHMDKNPIISIDNIRDLRKEIDFKAFEGKTKVVIISDCDKMTTDAANSFLKTLEEPPENTVIFLTTSRVNAILQTIQSRCQKIRFRKLPEKDIYDFLSQKYRKIADENIKLITKIADGSLAKAMQLLESKEYFLRNSAIKLLELITEKDKFAILKQLKSLDKKLNKTTCLQLLDIFQIFINDMMYLSGGSDELLTNVDKIDLLKKLIDMKINLFYLNDSLLEAKNFINSNVNIRSTLWLFIIEFWRNNENSTI